MCCKSFGKRVVPFTLAIGLGFFAVNVLQWESLLESSQKKSFVRTIQSKKGTGISGRNDRGLSPFYTQELTENSNLKREPFQIFSKPLPIYTDAARQNNVQGTVTLKITFLKNGQIGDILPITNLPDGLTEQAIAAAKQIKFKPMIRNGNPITITKTIQYNFTIY